MIIGNNDNGNRFKKENSNFLNVSNNFNNKFKQYQENKKSDNNIFVKDIKEQKYSDINNTDDIYNKSLAILNERLKNGIISLDEFTKQVNLLAKKRQK